MSGTIRNKAIGENVWDDGGVDVGKPARPSRPPNAGAAAMWECPHVEGLEMKRARHDGFSYGRHMDGRYVVCLVEEGTEAFSCRGIRHYAKRGCIVLLHPDDVHDGGSVDGRPWAYRCFHLPAPLMGRLTPCAHSGGVAPSFPRNLVEDPAMAAQLVSLHGELEVENDALRAQARFQEVFSRLIERHGSPGEAGAELNGRAHPSLRRVRKYLEEHLADPVRLEDLSDQAGLSPFHLLREFKLQFGLPPHEYLHQVRVHRAQALLRGGAPIAAVAHDTGFSDQSHLTRVFKRFTGVTPGRFQSTPLA